MRLILYLFIFSQIFAEDSFITKYEYSKMLYENPRGIGCNKCHGKYGKGKIIAKYKKRKKIYKLKAPDITKVSYKKFYDVLNRRKIKGAMPSYFLTRSEIKALYFYIKSNRKKDGF
ncbi:c-type cytochrome [Nitrosophilus kaiyonis]|uniref:c-type cytochrome n=1 Tax=Nitrosophilus kaiyonis TaxID=2930200 RepID=UPI0024920EB8|nr:c-type cytochrome [Nitrosophilus kaiyonis]